MNGKTNLSRNMYSAFENDNKSSYAAGASRGSSAPLVNIQLTETREI